MTYRTIKDLVVATYQSEGRLPSYEKLTALVRRHFPTSKWQRTHYAWYKSQIKRGGIRVPNGPQVSDEEGFQDEVIAISESVDTSVSLERDLHLYFATRIGVIEEGLKLVEGGVEFQTDAGDVDLLAKDPEGCLVVIELKAGQARDNALGQLLGYMGCLVSSDQPVRGILVASAFETRVIYAAKGLPNVKLLEYELSFSLRQVD